MTRKTVNTQIMTLVNFPVVKVVPTAPGPSQKKELSPGVSVCYQRKCKLKRERCFLCHSIVFCKTCNKCPKCCLNLPVGARLQNFLETCLDLGASLKVVQILKEGYTLPFHIRPNLTRSPTVITCYANPHSNLHLFEALHQLIDKNTVELVQNQKSLGFFNQLFLVPQPNNKWRPILVLSKLNQFLKEEKFKIETPETIRTSLQQGEWVTSIDFKDAYFHIPIQEQSRKYMRFHIQGRSYQFQGTAIRTIHSSNGVYGCNKGGEVDAHAKGYKDPPVSRRLVGENQIPLCLSPTYTEVSRNMEGPMLAGEFGKIGADVLPSGGLLNSSLSSPTSEQVC